MAEETKRDNDRADQAQSASEESILGKDNAHDESVADEPSAIVRKHSTSPVRKNNSARQKAHKSTEAQADHKRVGPVTFTKQCIGELKKVVWPTGEQTGQYFVVVLVYVLFIMAIVAGLDFGLTRLLLWLLG